LAEIAYRLDGKLILLPIKVNQSPAQNFMLDSGASHTVLDPRLTKGLGLAVTSSSSTTGTGAGAVAVDHVGPVALGIGRLTLAVADPWVIDLSNVPIDRSVRGLVGSELFKHYVVRIDPVRRVLSVFDPTRFRFPKSGALIPLVVEGDRLFLDAVLDVRPGLSVRRRLRIDTGSESSVNDPSARQSQTTHSIQLGGGLGTDVQGVSGLFDAVHVGPYTIRQVWGPGGDRPAIGMEILRRFVVTYDAPNGRMHLQPTAALNEPVPAPTP
jgi:hypothetical protein